EGQSYTDMGRPIIALIGATPDASERLTKALPGYDVVNTTSDEIASVDWSQISAIVIDLDKLGINAQLTLYTEASAAGYSGDCFAIGAVADPAIDRHLKLLNQPGLFVHSDETDLAILNVMVKRSLLKQRQSRETVARKAVGIAGTAREIAGLIKAWNMRLAHEQEPEEQQR
ncbi:MAG: hypothetical protein AAF556_04410, partial [Pseudomonadota bacterium]